MVLALPAQLTLAEASVCLRKLAQGLSEQSTEVALDASALTRFDSAALAVLQSEASPARRVWARARASVAGSAAVRSAGVASSALRSACDRWC